MRPILIYTIEIELIPFLVAISFPPCMGHSTVCTLCGFAYGMRGFPLAACGTLLGAGLCFVVLRLLFSKRLHEWSASNEKWQALETVVVCRFISNLVRACSCIFIYIRLQRVSR